MGFLHTLWDETVAGPAPESVLGKLRKFNSFSESPSGRLAPDLRATDDGHIPVSRSITVLRRSNPGNPTNVDIFSPVSGASSGSFPSSPATTGTPNSPRSPAPASSGPGHGGYFKKVARRKPGGAALHHQIAGDMKTPTAADNDSYWILLSALDRT